MDNPDNKSSEPLDAVSTAPKWSQVSKKPKKSRPYLYWLAGGAFAVVMVLALSSNPGSRTHQEKTASMNSHRYSASLNANLARLRALDAQKPTATVASDQVEPPLTRHVSKEMMARQNAPSSMYSSPASQTSQTSHSVSGRQTRQATFAGQGANVQFANRNTTTTSVHATRMSHPGFTIASGEFLHAVLETAINSDLPGMVRAVVSKPAYSYTGERTIIPAGSRLIGQYSSAIVQGQNRVMIIWNRVILPSGVAVQLNSPSTDALGRAGQGADSVNTHFFARFGQSALLSLIGAGVATTGVGSRAQYNSAAQYRMAISQSFQKSAQQSLQRSVPMKPTIHIDQGANINVFVAHDLSFYQVLKSAVHLPRPAPYFVK